MDKQIKMQEYWNDIRKNYPKAFLILCKDHYTRKEWGHIDDPKILGNHVNEPQWVVRHLFDFFDRKKIYVSVYTINGKNWEIKILRQEFYLIDIYETKLTSRKKAELFAFDRAFKLLEDKIKK